MERFYNKVNKIEDGCWEDIHGYDGLYQVSDCGKVKSLERVVGNTGTKNGKQTIKERILKPRLKKSGYHCVVLSKDGKNKEFLVHRLVASAFLEGDNTLTVNHIDECKTNNHVSNLEYLTQMDNNRAWNKNNPERRADSIKKAKEACSQKVFDTQTGKTFPSIIDVSRYMHDEEGVKGLYVWYNKIRRGTQNRFQIINN